MPYIKDMYGSRGPDFIKGFLAAMDTYSIYRNGEKWIGSPEQILKQAKIKAIEELGDDPREYCV